MLVEIFQIPQQIIGHAVRTCTDNQPYITPSTANALPYFPLGLQFSVRIGVSPENRPDTSFRDIYAQETTLPFFQLLGLGFSVRQ